MNPLICQQFFRKTPAKFLLFISYFISVNLLAGYCAVWLRYPSLWGGGNVFYEYGMPIGIWGLSHWPSLILISIPLLLIPHWNTKQINRFRAICISLFLILLYGVIEQIPFALFPAIDLLTAFFFSFVIAPPTYKENPKLTISMIIFLSLCILTGVYYLYSKWQHQTPIIKNTVLMNGLYKLKNIQVDNGYRKELLFTTELTQYIEPDKVCDSALEMGELLINTYAFDNKYNKVVEVVFNPKEKENNFKAYTLGLIEQYKEDDELKLGCYLKYK